MISHQAITWVNVGPHLCRHVAPLSHYEIWFHALYDLIHQQWFHFRKYMVTYFRGVSERFHLLCTIYKKLYSTSVVQYSRKYFLFNCSPSTFHGTCINFNRNLGTLRAETTYKNDLDLIEKKTKLIWLGTRSYKICNPRLHKKSYEEIPMSGSTTKTARNDCQKWHEQTNMLH